MRSSALLLRAFRQTAGVAGEDGGVQKASGAAKAVDLKDDTCKIDTAGWLVQGPAGPCTRL